MNIKIMMIPVYRCDDVFQCRDLSDETNCPLCAENEKECDGMQILFFIRISISLQPDGVNRNVEYLIQQYL